VRRWRGSAALRRVAGWGRIGLRARVLALVFGLVATGAFADESDGVHRAEEIRVEDQRVRPAEIFEPTPVEVEVLTADEIAQMPATNVADVVALLPGIRTQQRVQGEQSAVSIEGMPASYTLMLVNGRRYSGEVGGTGDLRDLPLANVERIEIIRGAGGLRHGPEAGGGVINVVTRPAPREGVRGIADGGYGSDRKILATATVGAGGALSGGTLSYTRDQIDGFDAPDDIGNAVFIPSGSDSTRASNDFYATFDFDPGDRVGLRTLGGFRDESEQFGPTSVVGSGEARTQQRFMIAQEGILRFTDSTELALSASWYDLETQSSIGRSFSLDESELELDAELATFLELGSTTHLLSFGVQGTTPRMQLDDQGPPTSPADPVPQPVEVDEGLETLGVYTISESQLTRWLDLEIGFRAQFHSDFEPSYLPQTALLVRPLSGVYADDLSFRFSYGRNQRTPSLRDLYQPDVPQLGLTYFLSGNPDLTPETSNSVRGGFEYNPVSSLSFAVTGYWNDIDDHIRSTDSGRRIDVGVNEITGNPVPIGRPGLDLICRATGNYFPECGGGSIFTSVLRPVYQKTNLDSVRTAGVESRMQYRSQSGLTLQLGYTFLDTQVVDSNVDLDELPNEARHVVDFEAFYRTPRTDTGLTARGRWRSSAPIETSGTGLLGFASTERSDPSLQIDFRVEQPITDRISIYADFYNVTDQRVIDSYVVRGRAFFGAMRITWP
jgi:outer membrane receptor for ferrienterochelin and colicin